MKKYLLCINLLFFISIGYRLCSGLAVMLEVKNPENLTIREDISEKINVIIREEIQKNIILKTPTIHYPKFIPQNNPHISILLDNSVKQKFDTSTMLSLQIMQSLKKGVKKPKNVVMTNKADLYGGAKDFFVIKISDPSSSLTNLRHEIEDAFRFLDSYHYQQQVWDKVVNFVILAKNFILQKNQKKKRGIFSQENWVRHSFSPHITLGKLPRKKIIQQVFLHKGNGKLIWNKIKERVQEEIFFAVQKRSPVQLSFESFQLYGAHRNKLKQYNFA
jgi:hypothetical protein